MTPNQVIATVIKQCTDRGPQLLPNNSRIKLHPHPLMTQYRMKKALTCKHGWNNHLM